MNISELERVRAAIAAADYEDRHAAHGSAVAVAVLAALAFLFVAICVAALLVTT